MQNKILEFFEPLNIPTVTHNSLEIRYRTPKTCGLAARTKTPYIGKTAELKRVEAKWYSYLAKHKPLKAFAGPIAVDIRFVFAQSINHKVGSPMCAKPDLDNMEKTLLDVMCKIGFYVDDRLIVDKHTIKVYGRVPGVYVRLAELKSKDVC
jgi:Holliday junction resolvase RusA-like endonuclease